MNSEFLYKNRLTTRISYQFNSRFYSLSIALLIKSRRYVCFGIFKVASFSLLIECELLNLVLGKVGVINIRIVGFWWEPETLIVMKTDNDRGEFNYFGFLGFYVLEGSWLLSCLLEKIYFNRSREDR